MSGDLTMPEFLFFIFFVFNWIIVCCKTFKRIGWTWIILYFTLVCNINISFCHSTSPAPPLPRVSQLPPTQGPISLQHLHGESVPQGRALSSLHTCRTVADRYAGIHIYNAFICMLWCKCVNTYIVKHVYILIFYGFSDHIWSLWTAMSAL